MVENMTTEESAEIIAQHYRTWSGIADVDIPDHFDEILKNALTGAMANGCVMVRVTLPTGGR